MTRFLFNLLLIVTISAVITWIYSAIKILQTGVI